LNGLLFDISAGSSTEIRMQMAAALMIRYFATAAVLDECLGWPVIFVRYFWITAYKNLSYLAIYILRLACSNKRQLR